MKQSISIDTADPLTESELDAVRHYARSLITRRKQTDTSASRADDFIGVRLPRPPATIERDGELYLDVEKIVGMFAWFDPDVSSVDLIHEANEAEARKYDKYFK